MKFIGGGRAGGGWGGCWGGWEAEGGKNHPQGGKQQCCVTVNLVGPDGRQQQFDTPSSLISAHQWPHRLCGGPSWIYRVGKRPPVKADLAICSPIVGVSGQWESVATMLNIKLDFHCCDNLVGFCKSSHIWIKYNCCDNCSQPSRDTMECRPIAGGFSRCGRTPFLNKRSTILFKKP